MARVAIANTIILLLVSFAMFNAVSLAPTTLSKSQFNALIDAVGKRDFAQVRYSF